MKMNEDYIFLKVKIHFPFISYRTIKKGKFSSHKKKIITIPWKQISSF